MTTSSGTSPERPKSNLLIVDDEHVFRHALKLNLERLGHQVSEASTLAEARSLLGLGEELPLSPIHLVLCDWKLGDENGLDLLHEINSARHTTSDTQADVLFMSAHASYQVALSAIDAGASDFITKPFEIPELIFRVNKLLSTRFLRGRLNALEHGDHETSEDRLGGLMGRSPQMRSVFRLIRRVAQSQSKLLITGESGTGKGLAARVIHQLSDRRDQPFIALNCSTLPEYLIESELFGHVKGSFTHAQNDRKGLIEEAEGGTLFLDEIGELPLALQAKLLRVLQEGEVRRVGANHSKHVDVRVIAATLKDLMHEVEAGRFRGDLYYRLNVIPIELPALRDRPDDLPLLIDQITGRLCAKMKMTRPQLQAEILSIFQNYRWPGNIRELENTIEHALVICSDDLITLDDLPRSLLKSIDKERRQDSLVDHSKGIYGTDLTGSDNLSIKSRTRILEEMLIKEALRRSGGVKTQAAKTLEISTKTLLYKLRDYAIEDEL